MEVLDRNVINCDVLVVIFEIGTNGRKGAVKVDPIISVYIFLMLFAIAVILMVYTGKKDGKKKG